MTEEFRQRLAKYPRYWDEARETMPPARRELLILARVQDQLGYAYEQLPFYRRLYDSHGVKPADVNSLDDYTAKIPVVTKDMLREDQERHPPFGSYSGTELADIIRIYGSSGTTGKPTIYGISKLDWEQAEEAQAMAAWTMGVRPDDIVHFLFPFGMFIGGWAILLGTTRLGAANFPAGAMDSVRHIEMMRTLGSTVLAGTPSYCLHLGEVAKETGQDLRELAVHTLVVGGEPGGTLPGTREAMRQIFGDVRVIDTGNTSECFPTQMNTSCPEETGVHVFEDEVFLEVVDGNDPHSGLPPGERGTTVYTTLRRRSQPMIRFMAGDETYLDRAPCPCGRTYPRLPEGLLGRADDMLIIRGANVYPSAVENALRQVMGVGAEYRLIVEKNGALDELSVESEYESTWLAAQGATPDSARADLRARIAAALKRTIGLRCTVRLVPPGSHESQLFKARRVIDRRDDIVL
jgi:phenylacetate-CoA ligase